MEFCSEMMKMRRFARENARSRRGRGERGKGGNKHDGRPEEKGAECKKTKERKKEKNTQRVERGDDARKRHLLAPRQLLRLPVVKQRHPAPRSHQDVARVPVRLEQALAKNHATVGL